MVTPPETDDEDAILYWIKVVSGLLSLGLSGYMVWSVMLRDDQKERLRLRLRQWWYRLGAEDRARTARNHLIFDLIQITEAGPAELGQELDRLVSYRGGR